MDVQIAARYRGCLHGRLPVDCTHFKGDVLVAVGGYSHAGSVHVFEPLEGLKAFHCCSHSARVDTVAFSQPSKELHTLLLCSCSAEVALLWDVQGCREASDKGMPCRAKTLATSLGYIQCASFSSDSQFVALGHGCEVLVYQVKTCALDTTLTGHNGDITAVMFYPKKPQHVVTTAEDRTFKIWNLRDSALLYQSAIISASPFTCLAIHPGTEALVLGSSDGKLRGFVLEGQHCHCVQESDIGRSLAKTQSRAGQHHLDTGNRRELTVISSHPKWKDSILASPDSVGSAVEMGASQLLGLFFWNHSPGTRKEPLDVPPLLGTRSGHPVRDVLSNTSHLVVVTHHSLLMLNSQTLELLDWKDLRDPLPVASSIGETSLHPVPVMCNACFCAAPVAVCDDLYCTSSALMEATVSVLRLSQKGKQSSQPVCCAAHAEGEGLQDTPTPSGTQLSVLSSAPLLSSSPLVAKMAAPSNATKLKSHSSASVSQGHFRKPLGVVDRPVTFHSKVKSSGYSSVPHGKLFTPLTSLSQRKAASAGSGTTRSKGAFSGVLQYPSDAQPPTNQELSLSLTDRPSAVNSLQYSCEGRHLACACSDGSVHVVNASLNADKGKVFVGHHGNVYSTCWSHGNPWIISCSSDKTARLWCLSQKDPLLTVSHSQTNTKIQQKLGAQLGNAKLGSKDNPPFSHEVTHAQFYYLDKFLLLACGNSFNLYKYHIDTERPDDVKRYQSSTKCRLVQQFPMQSAQHITALSAVNDFYSYIVLATGSDKNIEVFDMNAGRRAASLPEVQDRPVHSIVQNKGSKFIGHPPGAYDLFLTSAVSCGVKLWDLRTARCVQHYTSHPNRGVPLGAAFSPCAKFIATGAENRSVYIYDIRSTAPLHKLACHSNTVTTVTYHPLYNQMVTGTADGKLWLFGSKS